VPENARRGARFHAATEGHAATLEQAKADFRTHWKALKAIDRSPCSPSARMSWRCRVNAASPPGRGDDLNDELADLGVFLKRRSLCEHLAAILGFHMLRQDIEGHVAGAGDAEPLGAGPNGLARTWTRPAVLTVDNRPPVSSAEQRWSSRVVIMQNSSAALPVTRLATAIGGP
jgi:hypothetical protein